MVKSPPANAGGAGDTGLIPGSGGSPGERNGNAFQYSHLGKPMDGGAWWAIDHGVAKNWTLLNTPYLYEFVYKILAFKTVLPVKQQ